MSISRLSVPCAKEEVATARDARSRLAMRKLRDTLLMALSALGANNHLVALAYADMIRCLSSDEEESPWSCGMKSATSMSSLWESR